MTQSSVQESPVQLDWEKDNCSRMPYQGYTNDGIYPTVILQQQVNSLSTRQIVPHGAGEFDFVWTHFGFEGDCPEMTNQTPPAPGQSFWPSRLCIG